MNQIRPLGGHLLFSPGYQHLNLQTLFSSLEKQNYSGISQENLALNGSLQFIFWHLLTEFEGGVNLSAPVANSDYWLQLMADTFFVNLGYEFRPLKNLSIYPLVGLGMSSVNLKFTRRNLLPDFDTFLAQPGWQGQLDNSLLAINLGLGIDWHWDWGITLGLRGGYVLTPLSGNGWSMSYPSGGEMTRRICLCPMDRSSIWEDPICV